MNTINRRNFIRRSAIGGAGLMAIPNMLSASFTNAMGAIANQNLMSGLTPISIIDNACMLAFSSGEVSQKSQNVLFADIHHPGKAIGNKARLAVALPAQDKSYIQLIQSVKDNIDGLRGTDHLEGKHAMLFGWAAVNATDKFVNAEMNPKDDEEAALMRMHQDAILLQGFSTDTNPQ
ncbi:MAG TPA: twin-arginine translocation signal domain-containing protein, partial [Prolixibacteraceae bacterium]|nr:twin-arginine translocation signal domain-containing protein [Prolixibacteraceae bacterium]